MNSVELSLAQKEALVSDKGQFTHASAELLRGYKSHEADSEYAVYTISLAPVRVVGKFRCDFFTVHLADEIRETLADLDVSTNRHVAQQLTSVEKVRAVFCLVNSYFDRATEHPDDLTDAEHRFLAKSRNGSCWLRRRDVRI